MLPWVLVILSSSLFGIYYKYSQISGVDSQLWALYPKTNLWSYILISGLWGCSLYMLMTNLLIALNKWRISFIINFLSLPFFLAWLPLFFSEHEFSEVSTLIPRFFFTSFLLIILALLIYPKKSDFKVPFFFKDSFFIFSLTIFLWTNIFLFFGGYGASHNVGVAWTSLGQYFQYPAWNFMQFAGALPFNHWQYESFTWNWLLGLNGVSPFAPYSTFISYNGVILTYIGIGSVGAYVFSRMTIGLSRESSLFAGLIYTLNFYFQGLSVGEPIHLYPYLLAPIVFFLIHLSVKKNDILYALVAALIFHSAPVFHFAHSENFYIYYFLIFCLYFFLFNNEKNKKSVFKSIMVFGAAHACFAFFHFPYSSFFINHIDSVDLKEFSAFNLVKGFGYSVPLIYPYYIGITSAFFLVFAFFSTHSNEGIKNWLKILTVMLILLLIISLGKETSLPCLISFNGSCFPFVHYWSRFGSSIYFCLTFIAAIGFHQILDYWVSPQQKIDQKQINLKIIYIFFGVTIFFIFFQWFVPLLETWRSHKFEIFFIPVKENSYLFTHMYQYLFVLGAFLAAANSLKRFTKIYYLKQLLFILLIALILSFDTNVKTLGPLKLSDMFFSSWNWNFDIFKLLLITSLVLYILLTLLKINNRNNFLLILAILPSLHYIDQKTKLSSTNPLVKIIDSIHSDIAPQTDQWKRYTENNPRDHYFKDWMNKSANGKYKTFFGLPLLFQPHISAAEVSGYLSKNYSRYVELDNVETSLTHLSPFISDFNRLFNYTGGNNRVSIWRWYTQYDIFFPKEFFAYQAWTPTKKILEKNKWFFDLLGVENILVKKADFDANPNYYTKFGLKKVRDFSNGNHPATLLYNDDFLPIMSLIPNSNKFNENIPLGGLNQVNFRSTIFINEDYENSNKCFGKKSPDDFVKIRTLRGSFATAEVKSGTCNHLLFTDNYDPNWEAYVDGKKTKIMKTNNAFKSIIIPEGNHFVWFEFNQVSLLLGSLLSAMMFFLLSLICYRQQNDIRSKK